MCVRNKVTTVVQAKCILFWRNLFVKAKINSYDKLSSVSETKTYISQWNFLRNLSNFDELNHTAAVWLLIWVFRSKRLSSVCSVVAVAQCYQICGTGRRVKTALVLFIYFIYLHYWTLRRYDVISTFQHSRYDVISTSTSSTSTTWTLRLNSSDVNSSVNSSSTCSTSLHLPGCYDVTSTCAEHFRL